MIIAAIQKNNTVWVYGDQYGLTTSIWHKQGILEGYTSTTVTIRQFPDSETAIVYNESGASIGRV